MSSFSRKKCVVVNFMSSFSRKNVYGGEIFMQSDFPLECSYSKHLLIEASHNLILAIRAKNNDPLEVFNWLRVLDTTERS
jgi:hypothetical protein